MFNSPVLDTTIGLIFIFLIYSLLITSIGEAFASVFALRARMLRKGIIKGMLSNTIYCNDAVWIRFGRRFRTLRTQFIQDYCTNTWGSIFKAFGNFFNSVWRIISGQEYQYKPNTLGGDFYKHPIIKNYGASRRFSIPSYLGAVNFSTVLLDTLDAYYSEYEHLIIQKGMLTPDDAVTLPKISRIGFLLDYLNDTNPNNSKVDIETIQILKLYMRQSLYDQEAFVKRIEQWYDDSMDKVTGWYKRQMGRLLFFLGLFIAIVFNVNIIDIAGKLSTDKDARDKLVELAIKRANAEAPAGATFKTPEGLTDEQALKRHDSIINSVEKMIRNDVAEANNLLAIGWGDYGRRRDSAKIVKTYMPEFEQHLKTIKKADTLNSDAACLALYNVVKRGRYNEDDYEKKEYNRVFKLAKKQEKILADTNYRQKRALDSIYEASNNVLGIKRKNWLKFSYVAGELLSWRRLAGYFLFSFGVYLGAPFWFDLLQKMIRIRAAGKKETSAETPEKKTEAETSQSQVNVTLNNNQNTADAIG
ncbi:MAG TPA: hypothetical protein VGB50_06520 [Flavobacterium sp.]|jgi:hypothetical protein